MEKLNFDPPLKELVKKYLPRGYSKQIALKYNKTLNQVKNVIYARSNDVEIALYILNEMKEHKEKKEKSERKELE